MNMTSIEELNENDWKFQQKSNEIENLKKQENKIWNSLIWFSVRQAQKKRGGRVRAQEALELKSLSKKQTNLS